MAAQTSTFAKNWLFRLTSARSPAAQPQSETISGIRPALRWSLRWWGGCLLWLMLVLPAQAAVEIRVAISQGEEAISIGSSTPGMIRDSSGQTLYQLPELQSITLKSDNSQVDLISNGKTLAESSVFWLEPSENGFVWIGDKWYRGRVMVTLAEGELTVVNHVDLESYLYSVVGSEMPNSWPQAALQSQAVAARSYALYKHNRNRNPLYEVAATTSHQVYGGLVQEHPSTIAAVEATRNQVVTYNGQVIEAIFHSSSGGTTENAGNVWSKDVPYLQSVQDFDQDYPRFHWEQVLTLEEFSEQIGDIGKVHSIGTPQLTSGGRVASISITGDTGSETLRGRDVRSALKLRSTRFEMKLDKAAQTVTITGTGFGHGVGMSQWGARSLAAQGWSYEQILLHYYQSTAIAQLDI